MSTSPQLQTQTIEDWIQQEAERFSLDQYGKPFDELDAEHQARAKYAAKRFLRTRMDIPGECCDCGARIAEDKYQCRPCHEGMRQSEWNAYHRKAAYEGWL
jgi:hypothetical protein